MTFFVYFHQEDVYLCPLKWMIDIRFGFVKRLNDDQIHPYRFRIELNRIGEPSRMNEEWRMKDKVPLSQIACRYFHGNWMPKKNIIRNKSFFLIGCNVIKRSKRMWVIIRSDNNIFAGNSCWKLGAHQQIFNRKICLNGKRQTMHTSIVGWLDRRLSNAEYASNVFDSISSSLHLLKCLAVVVTMGASHNYSRQTWHVKSIRLNACKISIQLPFTNESFSWIGQSTESNEYNKY